MSVRMESQEGSSRAAESHLYGVFINHRGVDVKKTFVSHLDAALREDRLRPFLDAKDIERGRHVFKSIDEAIKGSCVHVAIFSKRYAESRHCLNELCDMLKTGKKILPVFYHVNPEDLRMIKNSPFKCGFRKRIKHATEEQILKWKHALHEISDYRGFRLDEVNGNEEELVREILAEVRRLMSNVLPGAIGVEPPQFTKAPEEPNVTFNSGDRRLNILVLGDPESVKAVVSQNCGAGSRQTLVEDDVNFRECTNSSPPMCLYSRTKGINRNDFTDIKTFVNSRNKKWRPTEVVPLWLKEVRDPGPRNWPALFPNSILRLDMVWFACRKLSDLPGHLDWPKIIEIVCDLPVQILVIEKQRTQDLDMNDQEDFDIIFGHGSDFFRNARKFMKDLIVKVSLQDHDLKGKLWRKCWAVKTRVQIGNAAKIIREIRSQLGPAGKSVQIGVGGATMSKKVSLSRSGEFVLTFLCTYWGIPQDSLRRVLQRTTNFISQARGSKISIEPYEFVKFCLIVAAIILYNAQDNAREPNVSSESSLDQLLETEAQDCYNFYFVSTSSTSLYYDKMEVEDIRLFLESIFERNDWVPGPVDSVDRKSFVSKIMKLICPR